MNPLPKTCRPSSFAGLPRQEFDHRADASAPILEILQAAERLSPGQTVVLRSLYEPLLLCRVLANRGVNHWSEDDGEGGHRIFFSKALE